MKRKRKRKRIVFRPFKLFRSLFFLGVVAALLFLTPVFDITEITVEGTTRLTPEIVITASGITTGSNIWRTSLDTVKKRLQTQPLIDTIHIKRRLPSSIVISITESQTAAYIPYLGNFVGIDASGKCLELLEGNQPRTKPTFINVNTKDFTLSQKIIVDETKKYDIIIMYINYLSENQLLDCVTMVDLGNLEDVSIRIWDKLLVKIGNEQNLYYQLRYLKALLNEIGEHSPGTLDLRNIGRASYVG